MSLGAALFKENHCFACHQLNGVGGTAGPALDDVGSRLDVATIEQQLRDPKSRYPNSVMPLFSNLSPDDIKALAEFLEQQKGGQGK